MMDAVLAAIFDSRRAIRRKHEIVVKLYTWIVILFLHSEPWVGIFVPTGNRT